MCPPPPCSKRTEEPYARLNTHALNAQHRGHSRGHVGMRAVPVRRARAASPTMCV